jgi:SAM-dependent methyltransferase
MNKLNIRETYRRHVAKLGRRYGRQRAMEVAIGGEFEAFGIVEREILVQYGLGPDDYVIDVGCGSGRLDIPLSKYLHGPYLGIDIVPELVDYARRQTGRPDWRFETATGLEIPESAGRADMVCFFSVFTHLLHEQSFAYLKEAHRVLKPGGRIVFSFLEFAMPNHWAVFESMVADIGGGHHLNVFMSRDGIEAWASHLELGIVAIHDGNKPHVPLPHPVTLDDGTVMSDYGNLGQSVCVLRK